MNPHTSTLSVLALVLTVVTVNAATIISGEVVSPINGHSYYLLSTDTWQNSEAAAVAFGGHLVTIRSDAENQFVFNTFGSFANTPHDLWLGLNDAAQEGVYVWTSGEPFSYRPTSVNFPTGTGNEDYIHIIRPGLANAGIWNDYPNNPGRDVNGVLEIVPEPGVCALLVAGSLALCARTRRPSQRA